jgi:glycosyltransferase involved in cell wall biosynthesis
MNILVISNFYPPHHIGGYGMLCLEVVNGLRARGHRVEVLTGMHGVPQPVSEGHIHRRLTLESDLYYYRPQSALTYPQVKRRNLAILREMVATEQPDVIFIWGMWALTKAMAQTAEQLLPGRVVYYLANPWPIDPNLHQSYWDAPANSPLSTLAKRLVRMPMRLWLREEWQPFGLQYEHVLCCSAAQRDQMLDAGVPLQHCPVVYEGIELAPYVAQTARRQRRKAQANGSVKPPLSLLFVGTLAEHKGVHTTIEALGELTAAECAQVHLTIVGSGHPQYESRLRKLAHDLALEEHVTFHAPIPRTELPDLLGEHDVLVLPSIWAEPLARIMQEGLASGLVVIGSATGGTAETIRHGDNGLLFPAGDGAALAAAIRQLLADEALGHQLAAAGQRTAIEWFALPRMVDDIESYLAGINETTLSHKSLSATR